MLEKIKRYKKNGSLIIVGRYSYGVERTKLINYGEGNNLFVGHFCSIANDCTVFVGGNHRIDWITTFPFGHIATEDFGSEKIDGHPASNGDVFIGHDVWIGRGSTIMSGVKIGNGAVIAANSHVVSDVADFQVYGGNPAKLIKPRFEPALIELLNKFQWWNLTVKDIDELKFTLSSPPTYSMLENLIEQYKNSPRYTWPPINEL
jgi:acetyltransferase-like isoleucine patch superfamily enzyme